MTSQSNIPCLLLGVFLTNNLEEADSLRPKYFACLQPSEDKFEALNGFFDMCINDFITRVTYIRKNIVQLLVLKSKLNLCFKKC